MTATIDTRFFADVAPAAASHSLVRPLPTAADPATRLAALALPPGIRLWEEEVPVAAADPLAAHRRARESRRPVDGVRTPARVLVLRYAGGAADLVVVAHRAVFDGQALATFADALTGAGVVPEVRGLGAGPATPPKFRPPAWGLADTRRAGRHGTVGFTAPAADGDAVARALRSVLDEYGDTTPFATLTTGPAAADVLDPPGGAAIGLVRPGFGAGYLPHLAPPFPITVTWRGGSGEIHYDEGFADPAVAAQLARHLARRVADPGAELVDDAEAATLVALGSTPGATADRTIPEAFAAVARCAPGAPALSDEGTELTYRELSARSAAVAAGLRAAGVEPGDRVGVCLDRTAELVVTLLGVLRAGAAYVPMDPAYPAERLAYTVEDAGIRVVVTTAADFPAAEGVRLVRPGDLDGEPGEDVAVSPDDVAYVIYTSGSTGRPKGVAVPHRNIAALLDATTADLRLRPTDVWTLFHSSAFDFSVWEIWGSLLSGAHLVVVPYWVSRSPEEFRALLAERRVTVLNQTPSAFAALRDVALAHAEDLAVRLVVFGGEPLDVQLLEPWFRRYSHTRCRVVNMFGITETTVHVTAQTVTPAEIETRSRSVGRALPGWSVSVRDEHGWPRPLGVPGEIHVGGAGVASHYLNLPDLTADRFVLDPVDGGRVYRSGDLGVLRPDGRLDHLGRIDSQVKLRGFRIEPGEIQSVLLGDPGVATALVVLHDGGGDAAAARLDAYFTGTARPDEVRRRATRFLPEHMVPSTFTVLDEIPLTVNGKADVARLTPAVAEPGPADVPREGGLLGEVLAVWCEVLGGSAAADDDFFETGGNSLLAVKLSGALTRAGLPPVALRELYVNSTPAELTALLATRTEG
ncbi:non-ribosomal peptide synthetase [Amycolatopsis sp. CA-126428]|uniref:non-ribosomal peptide synthetase n=1 Tax=Amycolatopsis sp. CA-126428 TaxID=2073158 RepID=UPI000CD1FFB4|nr:non-ribosomal peptide synthetase [Amycolatopsis sp. CA-126428]